MYSIEALAFGMFMDHEMSHNGNSAASAHALWNGDNNRTLRRSWSRTAQRVVNFATAAAQATQP